jgi:sec-independent protein translocase protein TatA
MAEKDIRKVEVAIADRGGTILLVPRFSRRCASRFCFLPRRSTNMGRIGLPELLIILAIIIIIFGANRLPGLGRGIGSAIKNFKDGLKDETIDHKP